MRWPPAGNLGPKTERSSLGGSRYKAARSGNARVTAAVKLDTCSLP